MGVRGGISGLAALLLRSHTERLHRLHMRRRFMDFKRKWEAVPTSHFTYEQRPLFYRQVHDVHLGQTPIDYLEFGSWRGDSMRAWSSINTCPESRFFGFDSFEGLPEDWDRGCPKGTFSESGRIPQIADARVHFTKGWFQESLPPFMRTYTPQARQVIHLDADLYSSTLFVLITLNPAPHSLLLFDEFSDVMHEFRAFEDFLSACQRDYRVLGARQDFHKLAIELL
ncbi:MAG: Demethyldecarbamoylnovobiocin O-methyltransferase [Nitrospira sp.]|nr:Demethyldecarbamoylnovobiocin O-methyltransferase [Nitrospira sp.]